MAMLATNPMPGKPSIRIGLLSVGFCVRLILQTMVYGFVVVGIKWCGVEGSSSSKC